MPPLSRSRRSTDTLDSIACAKVLKAMADPTRLRLLRQLIGRERNVSELVDRLKMEQPAVSHHLAVLRHANLVVEHREGKRVYYRLHPGAAPHLSPTLEKIDFGCCAVELRKE